MAGAHEGEDDRAFFHAAIERTYPALAATAAGEQLGDDVGALPPGRYLIQAINFADSADICWVHVGKFIEGTPIALSAGPGKDKVPLNPSGAIAIETNVVAGHSDRIGAIMSAGTCTVFITRVSRTSVQANP